METEAAFKRLLVRSPFYGLFCLSLPKEVTKKIDTLCVMKEGINCKLCINPDFWKEHTDDEQIALLEHELSHIALQHMFISDSFPDSRLFNISADAEVNSYIDNLPKDACTAKRISQMLGIPVDNGLGTKEYYRLLSQRPQQQQGNPQNQCNGGQGGNSNQQQPSSSSPSEADADESQEKTTPPPPPQEKEESDNGQQEKGNKQYPDDLSGLKPMDDHDAWKDFKDMPDANKQLMQNNLNAILKQTAEQVEKMRGTIPGNLVGVIEKLNEKKPEIFNWKAYFRRLLGSIYDVNIKSTRRKESKRFEGAAGIQHRKKVSILVAVDTSGSVSDSELQEFFSEIDYVCKAGARVTLIECDTRINSITEYDGKKIPQIHGRGGTSFNPPVDYYAEHRKEYASLIYFTDGEAPLPDKNPSGMVWVITSDGYHQDYPGKAIYIPKQNQ